MQSNRHAHCAPGPVRGFTLVEVLIAVIIVGVLTALAFPSFSSSIRKSRRAEAVSALSAVQLAQERWRANHSTYASSLTGAWPAEGLGLPSSSSGERYSISIALDGTGETGYDVLATAATGSSQVSDGKCVRLAVQVRGAIIKYGSGEASGALDYSKNNPCWSR